MNDAWFKPAVLGVGSVQALPLQGGIGELIGQITDGVDPASGFSRSAGVLAACALAAIALQPALDSAPAPAPADARMLPVAHPWAATLAMVFNADSTRQSHDLRLQFEACEQLHRQARTLPHALLPAALAAGQRSTALRTVLLPVLGHRGHWLAGQNPDWAFASPGSHDPGASASESWQEGHHHERLAHVRRLRASDPAQARQLLQAGLADLPAKERLDFVNALDAGLGSDDAPLLESLLKDRSRDVRQAVARLLARLPESSHARQLAAWMAPLVLRKKALLGTTLQLEAPTAADPTWSAAGIDIHRPANDPLGERAWWLYQLVRLLPLDWWNAHTGMDADALVAWSARTDWTAALLRGWRDRVGPEEPRWIEALLRMNSGRFHHDDVRLLAMLPVDRREAYWPRTIDQLQAQGLVGDVIAAHAPGQTLSPEYSASLLPSLVACFAGDRLRHDYPLRSHLLDLAAIVHPDALHRTSALARPADETAAMADCATEFERIIRIRTALHAQPDTLPPTGVP